MRQAIKYESTGDRARAERGGDMQLVRKYRGIRARLRVGKALAGKGFTLPLDIATQAMAVLGLRGKGKTVTASVIVEELLKRRVQVVAIDPTDSWWGLKSSADGLKAGFPVVILGGDRGDLPLSGSSGHVVADFAVEHGVSLVLSLRHMRKGEQRRFVTDFAEQLYHRKGEPEHRTPLFLAIDEANQFVPQRVMGDTARMVGAIQDLVRMGRHAGIGVALIDQRPATVNKDVLTQIELLVCHAVTAPQDRKALLEWIRQKDSAGHEAEFLEHLASLPQGEAWFWCPILDVFERVRVRMRKTFDSSRTPKHGEAAPVPEKVAPVDLDALRDAMAETVAEAEANDPRALRRRIVELERELRAKPAGGPTEQEIQDRIYAEVEPHLQELEAYRAQLDGTRPIAERLVEALRNGDAPEQVSASSVKLSPSRTADAAPTPPRRARPSPHRGRPAVPPRGDAPLSKGERIIITAVAQHDGVTREQLSVLTAYKRSSRDTYLQRLSAAGLVTTTNGLIVATEAGVDALGPEFELLPTGDALLEHWLARLPQGERIILDVVVAEWPDWLSRQAISGATLYKRSSRDTYIQRLRARNLVTTSPEGIRASDELFDRVGCRRG